MNRTGTPNTPTSPGRIPFPHADAPTAWRTNPEWFSHETTGTQAAEKDIAQAKRACSGCPIVEACLKWALANPDLTPVGVWAATTARQRTTLRRGLAERLGPDWVGVVAARDRARAQRRQAARLNPPTVREQREQVMARLELERVPHCPPAYEPWREPITPQRAARNRAVLQAALTQPKKGAEAA